MQSHYITYKNSSVHYRQFGNGPKLLFCFHGYGRESYTFSILERKLGHLFTIIAIDVPFHGLTQWKDELVLQPKYMANFLLQIRSGLHKENTKFSLLGFSMGGRVALHLTQLLADKVERLILLAPDGLNFNFWRWLMTNAWPFNKLLAYTIRHPKWVSWIIDKAEKWNVIHRSLADFIRYYIDDDDHRFMFYNRYISMRKFSPAFGQLKQFIRKYRITVKMMFGAFDRVIPSAGGEKFKEGIEEFASVKVIEAGHHLLSEAQVGKIAQLIND